MKKVWRGDITSENQTIGVNLATADRDSASVKGDFSGFKNSHYEKTNTIK